MANSVNTFSSMLSEPTKILPPKVWALLSALIIVIAFYGAGRQVYLAQPNKILINPSTLSLAEYQVLNKATSNYKANHFFTAPLPEIEDRVMAQDWVSQVNIERKWREGIKITALPRKAVARFGSEQLIDAQGYVFKPVDETALTQSGLTMLQGESDQSFLIMQQMQQVNQWFAPLNLQVVDMVLTPRMTWIIKFNDGLRVVVDNERTSQKLMNLSQLLQNQLSSKRVDIASVDLRYKNGFVIRWHHQEAPTTSESERLVNKAIDSRAESDSIGSTTDG